MRLLFDSWWVLENVTTHYFAFDFLSCETETNRRIILPFWLVSNAVLTICVIHFHIPGAFLWDMLFLAFFSRFILKTRLKEARRAHCGSHHTVYTKGRLFRCHPFLGVAEFVSSKRRLERTGFIFYGACTPVLFFTPLHTFQIF